MDRSSWERDDLAPTAAEQFGDIVESTTTADAGEYEAVLVGEPYDYGTVTRRGACDGPAAVRAALSGLPTHHLNAGPVDAVGDLGSVDIPFGASVATARDTVRGTVDVVHDSDAVPVILGGDSSLTTANVAGLLHAEAATDGPRTSSELRSDGGFGDDEESVGDVEHFDPAGGAEETEDRGAEDEETETPDATETVDDGPTDEDTESGDEPEEADEDSDEGAEAGDDSDSDDEEPTEDDTDAASDETDEGESAEQPDHDDETDDDAGSGEVVDDSGVGETGFGAGEKSATEVVEETTETAPTETGASETTSTESVGVIRLGARLDCQPVGSEPTNRSVVRQLLDAGVDSLAVVGVRHFESTTAEAEYLRDNGGDVVTAEEIGTDPVEATDRALGTVEDADYLYVSIDLSVLDATTAPGVSTPAPGGLQSRELFRVVRLLASDDRLAGLELVETAPTHDRDGQTVDAAARTVAHALAALQA